MNKRDRMLTEKSPAAKKRAMKESTKAVVVARLKQNPAVQVKLERFRCVGRQHTRARIRFVENAREARKFHERLMKKDYGYEVHSYSEWEVGPRRKMNWYDVLITGNNRRDIGALVEDFLKQMGYENPKLQKEAIAA